MANDSQSVQLKIPEKLRNFKADDTRMLELVATIRELIQGDFQQAAAKLNGLEEKLKVVGKILGNNPTIADLKAANTDDMYNTNTFFKAIVIGDKPLFLNIIDLYIKEANVVDPAQKTSIQDAAQELCTLYEKDAQCFGEVRDLARKALERIGGKIVVNPNADITQGGKFTIDTKKAATVIINSAANQKDPNNNTRS